MTEPGGQPEDFFSSLNNLHERMRKIETDLAKTKDSGGMAREIMKERGDCTCALLEAGAKSMRLVLAEGKAGVDVGAAISYVALVVGNAILGMHCVQDAGDQNQEASSDT